MPEEVFSGGTKIFRYDKDYKVEANSELKKEIEKGYEEYYRRKRFERKKKIILFIVFLLFLIILFYFLIT